MDEEGSQKAGLSQAGPWLAGTETGLVASQQLWAPPRTIGLARTDIGPGGAAAHLGPGGFVLPHAPRGGPGDRGQPYPLELPGFPAPTCSWATWGTPGRPPATREAALPDSRSCPPVARPLLGVAVSSEATGFHKEILSSQQGQPQFGSSGFMDNKKARPIKKRSWHRRTRPAAECRAERTRPEGVLLSLRLLTSGCIVCADGEE